MEKIGPNESEIGPNLAGFGPNKTQNGPNKIENGPNLVFKSRPKQLPPSKIARQRKSLRETTHF